MPNDSRGSAKPNGSTGTRKDESGQTRFGAAPAGDVNPATGAPAQPRPAAAAGGNAKPVSPQMQGALAAQTPKPQSGATMQVSTSGSAQIGRITSARMPAASTAPPEKPKQTTEPRPATGKSTGKAAGKATGGATPDGPPDPVASAPRKSAFSPTPFTIAGYLILLVIVGGLGGWAATAPLASAVIAAGTVSVESNRKIIQHLEGGIVDAILVREAEKVDAGDVLLRLTATQANASHSMLESRYIVARATQARLRAERVGKAEFTFPEDLETSSDPRVEQVLKNQQELFDDRHAVLKSQIDILRSRIEQYHQSIAGLNIQKEATQRRLESSLEEVERLREGEGSGAVATNRLTSMERDTSELQGIYGRYVADIANVSGQINQTEQEIIGANQAFRERAAIELKTVRDELNELEERLIVSHDVLERTEIRAPRDGIVQNLKVHTIGGVVRPGDTIMEIVPLGDELIVNAQVRPLDVDSISADLQAEVKFPAFSSRTLPLILGRVEFISPDIIAPDDMRMEPYYLARIIVEEEDIPALIRDRMVPGMPADVIIATTERTLLNYLITPLSDAITKSMREE